MAHTKPIGPIWIDFKSFKNSNVIARSKAACTERSRGMAQSFTIRLPFMRLLHCIRHDLILTCHTMSHRVFLQSKNVSRC